MQLLPREDLTALFMALAAQGYRTVGPTVRDGAIMLDELSSPDELPSGIGDEQAPGKYRLHALADGQRFAYAVGPESLKRLLFPPRETLVQIRRRDADLVAHRPSMEVQPTAVIGARACDLAAMKVQDRVFTGGPHGDPRYDARRRALFIVAVNCGRPASTCFCDSTGTGPRARDDFDLCLTELEDGFALEIGSERGQRVADALPLGGDSVELGRRVQAEMARCRAAMSRRLDTDGLPELLFGNLDHPRFAEVAERCLACGNCTQVCPTCFCHTVEEHTVVGGDSADRVRRWDSCFTESHGQIHGHNFRPRVEDRYRQWLTHKLSSWMSQFGTSGCVGCGRCLTWCPVGIDLTEEAAAIRANAAPARPLPAPREAPPIAGDPMVPVFGVVRRVERETSDVCTLAIEVPGPFRSEPGQFNMVSLPGVGESPISLSGQEGGAILHTIRAVGATTAALDAVAPGDAVGIRGPFGRGWPLDVALGRNVTVIAGGLGIAPLRGAIREMLARPDRYPSVRLLYGARSPADIVFDREILAWSRDHAHFRASVTVDTADAGWTGHVGVVTTLMSRKELSPHGVYFLCGPEVMMGFVLEGLRRAGIPSERIWLSMERNMKCAAGLCGRCQYGPHFVCKDGPVFRHDEVVALFGQKGF